MATNSKKRNLLYTFLVLAGLLLLILPFLLFKVGDSAHGTDHFTRFGLHLLAFATAIVAGSLFTSAITSAGSSVATVKVAAWAATAIVGSAVTYNTVYYTLPQNTITLKASLADSISIASPAADTISVDSSYAANEQKSLDTVLTEVAAINETKDVSEVNEKVVPVTGNIALQKESSDKKSVLTKQEKTVTKDEDKNASNNTAVVLQESCNSFQVLHGSGLLDRKLGLSVFDPNKTIRFQNDCGCILKDASMNLTRGNTVVEQKKQNGNFINLHNFKDLQADDRLTVEIRQANCKNDKGSFFVYSFPKPILSVIIISDHNEFETASEIKNKKQSNNTPIDNSISKPAKDKVEEEINKYGN